MLHYIARVIKNLPNEGTQEKKLASTNYLPQEKHNLGEEKVNPRSHIAKSDFRLIVEDF